MHYSVENHIRNVLASFTVTAHIHRLHTSKRWFFKGSLVKGGLSNMAIYIVIVINDVAIGYNTVCFSEHIVDIVSTCTHFKKMVLQGFFSKENGSVGNREHSDNPFLFKGFFAS